MNGTLPDYYISTADAMELGWNGEDNLHVVANGKQIGGDRFYDYDKKLPFAVGRIWYEADINYKQGARNKHRIVYSNDGLVFVTYDLYETFFEIVGVAGNKKANPQTGGSTRYSSLQDAKDDYGSGASLLDVAKKAREIGGDSTGGDNTVEPDPSTNTYYESIIKQYEVNGIEYKEVYQHESGRAIITTSKKVNGKWEYVSSRPYSKDGPGGVTSLNSTGYNMIANLERNLSLIEYDKKTGLITSIPTTSTDVGYGHDYFKNPLPSVPISMSASEAYALLIQDAEAYERAIASINASFTQDQFNALIALRYNVGSLGVIDGLLEYLEKGSYERAKLKNLVNSYYDAIIKSNSANEKYRDGWYNRTEKMLDIFFDGNYGSMPIDAVNGKVIL